MLIVVALAGAGVGSGVTGQSRVADGSSNRTARSWIDASALDPSTPACTNFYQHACGGFIASHPASAAAPSIAINAGGSADTGLDDLLQQEAPDPELGHLRSFSTARAARRRRAATAWARLKRGAGLRASRRFGPEPRLRS